MRLFEKKFAEFLAAKICFCALILISIWMFRKGWGKCTASYFIYVLCTMICKSIPCIFFWVVRSSQKREDVKFPGNQSQFTVKCLDGCRCSDSFGGKKQILNKKQESGGVIKFTLFKNKQKTTETNKHTKKTANTTSTVGVGEGRE